MRRPETLRSLLAKLWRYWTAFLRTDGHGQFSLARLGMVALLGVIVLAVQHRALRDFALGFVLCCFGILFYSDITKSKAAVILAGRWGIPGGAEPAAECVSEPVSEEA